MFTKMEKVASIAKRMKLDGVIFGHIHVPVFQDVDGTLLMNPGSHAQPRNAEGKTYLILDIDNDGIKPQLKTI